MPLPTGTQLGPYEIVAALGAGGMGEVYRARDIRLERIVAIKILPSQFSADVVRKQRFEREAKTISHLNHPHICTLHDIGSQDGIEYLVMECVEGETLAKRLEKGPLPLEQVLRVGGQIADALDQAHRSGVVHRDLKPGNVMLTPSGAKLLDFGLAKATSSLATLATLTATKQESPVTEQGTIVGTFQYMSPEQVEGKELDGRSDIFSLGAVLYEMLTGHRAFEGKSQLSVASAILEREPQPVSEIKPLTPPALDHLIKKCLAKAADERWQSARDVKSELNWIADSSSHAGTPDAVVRVRKNRERLAWTVTAACAVVGFASLLAYIRLARAPHALLISSVLPPQGMRFGGIPKLSPDGRTVVFAAVNAQGIGMLWLRPLDSFSAHPVHGTENASSPFWSADGRAIGFFADGKLKTVQVTSGSILSLCDAPGPVGGTWNQQGTILFVPEFGVGIYRVPASGGSPSPAISSDKSKVVGYAWPDFLPDGSHFIYSAYGSETEYTGTYFASLDGRESRLVTHATGNFTFASSILFYPRHSGSSTDLMAASFDPSTGTLKSEAKSLASGIEYVPVTDASAFAVSDRLLMYEPSLTGAAAESTLVWFDRSGKRLSEVTAGRGSSDLRLSPDGRKVAYAKGDLPSDIWIQELKRDVPMRLTFDRSADKGAPTWSPDGNALLFDITPGGNIPPGIYRKSSSGTGAEELLAQPTESDTWLWPTDWSRDGRFLLCVQGQLYDRSRGEIWVLPISADRKPRVFIHAPGAAYDGQFSPDGRWVAYVSRESGHEEVYVVPFDGNQVLNTPPSRQVAISNRWQVSASGGGYPRWRRDGKELFFVTPGGQFMATRVDAKGSMFSMGESRPLFRGFLSNYAFPYDVSPDGQRFLVNGAGETGTLPFTLVEEWKEMLKDK